MRSTKLAVLLLAAAIPSHAAPPEPPKELADLVAPFRFGMTREEVAAAVSRRLDEDYEERLAKAADSFEAARLERRKSSDLAMFSKTFVEFGAEKSAWDVSLIEGQFAHGTGESMFVFREGGRRRYLFLFEGKLWRIFIEGKAEDRNNFEALKGSARIGVEVVDRLQDYDALAVALWDPAVAKKVERARKK